MMGWWRNRVCICWKNVKGKFIVECIGEQLLVAKSGISIEVTNLGRRCEVGVLK